MVKRHLDTIGEYLKLFRDVPIPHLISIILLSVSAAVTIFNLILNTRIGSIVENIEHVKTNIRMVEAEHVIFRTDHEKLIKLETELKNINDTALRVDQKIDRLLLK